MRNLLRCRRGTAAFATVIALVPLLGFMALGGEAASWYVTKQHAQNAADAAAYSGALRLACTLGLATSCGDAQTVDYRGRQFATQNGFSNTACGSNPGVCVTIDAGTYSAGTFTANSSATTTNPSGNAVRAKVQQTQPGYLAALLGLTQVDIGAQATAQVNDVTQLCGLGLGRYSGGGSPASALEFGGGATLSGKGCGFQSDNTVKYDSAQPFNGTGWAVYGTNGCTSNAATCSLSVPYNYYMPSAANPLSVLDSESFNSRTGNTSTCKFNGKTTSCTLSPNASGAYGDLTVNNGNTLTLNSGTYFFYNAKITINGGTVTGIDVTLVLLGDSSLSISGGTVKLSAPASNTTSSDLNGVLIDDQAPNKSNNAVTITGGAGVTIALGGSMYFPNVDVTMSGNSQNTNTQCTELVANSIKFSGTSAYLSTTGCASNTVATTQVITLVH